MTLSAKYTITAFLVGLLLGGVAGRFIPPGRGRMMSPEKRQERLLKHFQSELNLTPEQKTDLSTILKSSREQTDALLSEVRPKFEALRSATAAQIRAKLNPDQQEKFDKMHERFEKRWKSEHRDGPFL